MKIFIVLLSMSIVLLVILQSSESISVTSVFHRTIVNMIPSQLFVYAQNNTLYHGGTNTGAGINTGITNITTENDLPNAVGVPASLPKSQQIQVLHLVQHKKPVPLPWLALHSQSHENGSRIGLIVPVFTGASYNDAFYIFYKHYAGVRRGENITHNVSLLSSIVTSVKLPHSASISASAYAMRYLDKHLALLTPKNNVSVLTDIDVDGGSIFMDNKNTTNRYDIIILGHQEYVTQQEYTNLKTFVTNGGTMILFDGNVFYVQVGYDRITHTITLIKGHGWAFNGKPAWKSVGERWANETSQWIGSNYLCSTCKATFAYNPFGYNHREEQQITNAKDTILLNYNASILSPNPKIVKNATSAHAHMIATYELNYKKGKVIGLGMYSDDIIDHRNFLVFFDHLLMARQFS